MTIWPTNHLGGEITAAEPAVDPRTRKALPPRLAPVDDRDRGKFRNAHKFDDSYTPKYHPNVRWCRVTRFMGPVVNNDYYMNDYKFGPTTDWTKIMDYLNSNPSAFTLDPTPSA